MVSLGSRVYQRLALRDSFLETKVHMVSLNSQVYQRPAVKRQFALKENAELQRNTLAMHLKPISGAVDKLDLEELTDFPAM